MSSCRISIRRTVLVLIAVIMLLLTVANVPCRGFYAAETEASDDAEMAEMTGFVRKKDNWYYYLNGIRQKGWITAGNNTYYANETGKQKYQLVKGWLKYKKKWYYFREKGRKGKVCSMVKGRTLKVNGITCIFNTDGSFQKCKHAGRKKGFVQKIGEMARENQARYNILASLTAAQACLETGYGRHVHHNNLFGIRAGTGYRRYKSWKKSMEDYSEFMKRFVPEVFGVRNSIRACSIVGSSGYAQARNYGSMLISVIQLNNLTRFNK